MYLASVCIMKLRIHLYEWFLTRKENGIHLIMIHFDPSGSIMHFLGFLYPWYSRPEQENCSLGIKMMDIENFAPWLRWGQWQLDAANLSAIPCT